MTPKETYQEYKLRKRILNEHQSSIELGVDAIEIISKQMTEANRLFKQQK